MMVAADGWDSGDTLRISTERSGELERILALATRYSRAFRRAPAETPRGLPPAQS